MRLTRCAANADSAIQFCMIFLPQNMPTNSDSEIPIIPMLLQFRGDTGFTQKRVFAEERTGLLNRSKHDLYLKEKLGPGNQLHERLFNLVRKKF